MDQLELVFRLLVRLQLMYLQYKVYLSIVVRTYIIYIIYICLDLFLFSTSSSPPSFSYTTQYYTTVIHYGLTYIYIYNIYTVIYHYTHTHILTIFPFLTLSLSLSLSSLSLSLLLPPSSFSPSREEHESAPVHVKCSCITIHVQEVWCCAIV